MDVAQAVSNQLRNIEAKTGKALHELEALIRGSGLAKHGQIVAMLKSDLGLGHGDANMLTLHVLKSSGAAQAEGKSQDQVLDEMYSGAKSALRPIHDKLMTAISGFGDFEVAPKKGYVSLRRKKQFAMIGPATNTRVDVSLIVKGLATSPRLLVQPEMSMCQYKVRVSSADEVDAELMGWIRQAYDAAG